MRKKKKVKGKTLQDKTSFVARKKKLLKRDNRSWEKERIIQQVNAQVEPVSRAVVRRERRKLLNRRKRRYNIHQIQDLSPDKFARVVNQCLQNEAVLVGVKK